jgi:DNA-binding NarL/FixJ family response regulator
MPDQTTDVSVLLADDDPNVRQALRLLCEQALDLTVAGEAKRVEELLLELPTLQPDIILLDWELPGEPAVSANLLTTIRTLHPARIIILGRRPEAQQDALNAGGDAFIYKGDSPDKLLALLHSVRSTGT